MQKVTLEWKYRQQKSQSWTNPNLFLLWHSHGVLPHLEAASFCYSMWRNRNEKKHEPVHEPVVILVSLLYLTATFAASSSTLRSWLDNLAAQSTFRQTCHHAEPKCWKHSGCSASHRSKLKISEYSQDVKTNCLLLFHPHSSQFRKEKTVIVSLLEMNSIVK